MAQNRRPGAGDKRAEGAAHQLRRRMGKFQFAGLHQEVQRPAAHHGVIGDNPQGRKHHQEAEPPARTAGNQLADGRPAIGPAAAPDDGLRQKNGDGQQQHKANVNDNESGASVHTHQVREAPDIAQADSGPRKGQDYRCSAAEFFSGSHISSFYKLQRYEISGDTLASLGMTKEKPGRGRA